jgi:hypothetical protein
LIESNQREIDDLKKKLFIKIISNGI